MGDIKGFMKYDRKDFDKEPIQDHIKHWRELYKPMPEEELRKMGKK